MPGVNYSDIKLSSSTIKKDQSVNIYVKVTNAGASSGEEVAQLYVTDLEASTHTCRFMR